MVSTYVAKGRWSLFGCVRLDPVVVGYLCPSLLVGGVIESGLRSALDGPVDAIQS